MFIADSQYYIRGEVFGVLERRAGSNGLVDSVSRGGLADPGDFAIVRTGTETGGLLLTVDVRDAVPEPPDLDAWEEIVEVSLTLPGECPGVLTAGDEDEDAEASRLPDFTFAQPGPFRVRVHARGRDEGDRLQIVEEDEEPVEEHYILVWSAPVGPSVAHKWTDTYGERIRSR
ncbi:hypothetical protein [Streptomyces sp. B15]|uniref:hypothetical protein n=1 Tax=Streptomyces sp. B15 TaxID=1537797 RepID=UPI001B3742E1|nr:hypothetical protein [Streptomyces sp. B15]MBQ1124283.1 hypothetical protein [Streptomyces sp. B15]